METSNINLQLGDIIKIIAPSNSALNEHIFFINYLDNRVIKLIDTDKKETIILNIDEDGNLTDESIQEIELLSRANSNSYAKQNNFLPNTWIDVYFNGEIPLTITGEITNLEEDMIEIKTFPDNDVIYLDFSYKGIPEDIPIEKIIIRNKPSLIGEVVDEPEIKKDLIDVEDEDEDKQISFEVPVQEIKTQLRDILLDADQIEFGPELESITQIVDVPESQRKYSIESQLNDLLDELLSQIPNAQRTRSVLNNIHIEIERFKQLREDFSKFDKNNNALLPNFKGANYKPLVEKLQNLNFKLNWILPVVNNKKKLYDVEVNEDFQSSDVIPFTMAESIIESYDIRESYLSNETNYSSYMNKLNPFLTPFESIKNDESLIYENVNTNMEAIVDNLTEFYSSVAKNDLIKRKRFLIAKYNLGLNKLHATKFTSTKMNSSVVQMTPNDTMNVTSFITLPQPTVFFSNIHLPKTSIIDRCNLNMKYFNYWQYLRENTYTNTQFIDNLNSEIRFDEKKYLKNITQFILNNEIEDSEKTEKFLNIIIPKTKLLFNLIKKYVNESYSLIEIVKYLQPFLINLDDISFKQYQQINIYIEQQILNYKKNFAQKKELFNSLSRIQLKNILYESILYKLLKDKVEIADLIFQAYGFNEQLFPYVNSIPEKHVLSSSEIIHKMINLDYSDLYNLGLSSINLDLFSPFDFNNLLDEKEKMIDDKLEQDKDKDECKNFILTKRYIDLEDLQADDGEPVYYDKKFDPTIYDILNEYKFEMSQMDNSTFKQFLIDQIMNNIGLNRKDAKYEAESMINGKREVLDGNYCVLEIDNIDSVKYFYYKRENNKWVRDEKIPENTFFGTSEFFCNIQEKCIQINKNCENDSVANVNIKKNIIDSMYKEFDTNYDSDYQENKEHINKKFKYQYDIMNKLVKIQNYNKYKYEMKNQEIGKKEQNIDIIESPYAKLRDIILGQEDFVKKQNDIILFTNKFTRGPNEDEHQYWLYCIETNTKLLPSFIYKLASTFVENGDYYSIINIIEKDQGVIQENVVVDKYSGYIISKISLNTEEDFDEAGRKVVSSSILEKEFGTSLLQNKGEEKPTLKKELLMNPKGKIINNILTSLSNFMGINVSNFREDIIYHTLLALEDTVDDEEIFNKKMENIKKKQKYEDVFYTSLLAFTLAYLTIYIQISIPNIQSNKTFPGCKKSFVGYPITGEEDLSNIIYLACICSKIKTNNYPWKVLPKNVEKIKNLIKKTIDSYILNQTDTELLIQQKREYLLQNQDDFIPIELDIKNWLNFLPPLVKIENKTTSPLTDTFKEDLLKNIKSGNKTQFDQINTIVIKRVNFTMDIIKEINNVVEKEKPLLTNLNNVPFIQNSCCNTGEFNTTQYFINKKPSIETNNNLITYLNNILIDIKNMTRSPVLLDIKNTKIKFPELNPQFSENTIYRAFIEYCNFDNDFPVNEKLVPICMAKPDEFDKNASIEEKIELLKKEGKNYSLETFNEMMEIVNKMNILNVKITYSSLSSISQIRDLLTYMNNTDYFLDNEFIELFLINLDRYDIKEVKEDRDTKNFRNYLAEKIDQKQLIINDYITKYCSFDKNEKKKIIECIETIMDFKKSESDNYINADDETLFNTINFIKNSIFNLINIFPSIIVDKVDYDDVKIHKHWGLSELHKNDVKTFIKDYYQPLKQFYGKKDLYPFISSIQNKMRDFLKLIELTHLYSSVLTNKNETISSFFSYRTVNQLFQFYFINCIFHFLEISKDYDIIQSENITPEQEDDIITTTVEIDEEATGEITEIEIARGMQKEIRNNLVDMIVAMLQIICKDKKSINVNPSLIKEKINNKKDKERNKITTNLREMEKEEREIENLFKNHRLERWNKGLQKGLTQYVSKTYDEERMEREKDEIMERQIDMQIMGQAFEVDREILRLENEQNEINNNIIENDEYSLDHLPDDDDYGEIDDGYMLEYDNDI